MAKNKIKYGLKNVHYAVITEEGGNITYGTPKPIPGAVSLSATAKGEKNEFYADDILFFGTTANQGYEGELEVAMIPDEFRKDVMGDKTDQHGVIFEDASATPKNIALLFEFSGDQHASRCALYYVMIARPDIESETKKAQIEPKTEKLKFMAGPHPKTEIPFAKCYPEKKAQYDAWFQTVHEYTE
ncbi:MAG: phage tail protein [Peptostreptococcaceae bacterium]|nr:phage tail protein [Peptostreptococcaceae bacterium]